MNKSCGVRISVVCVLIGIETAVADVPQSNRYLYWSPHFWSIAPGCDDAIWPEVDVLDSYGHHAYVENLMANSPTQCTATNLQTTLVQGKGVVLYEAHGNSGQAGSLLQPAWVFAEEYPDGQAGKDAADARAAQYNAAWGANSVSSDWWGFGGVNHPIISCSSTLTLSWCKQFYPSRQGISMTAACSTFNFVDGAWHSQGYDCFYSQACLGYDKFSSHSKDVLVFPGVLERMNGLSGLGSTRPFMSAYSFYVGSNPIALIWGFRQVHFANGADLELCPVPVVCCPAQGSTAPARVGTGTVTFSAAMDHGAVPSVTLTGGYLDPGPSGTATAWWKDERTLGFQFHGNNAGLITVLVSGDCHAKTQAGMIYVDGNDATIGNWIGVAPNRDGYKFSFYVP